MYDWCPRLNQRRALAHRDIWYQLQFLIKLFQFLEIFLLLGGFELGYEVLDIFGVDAKFVECGSDEDSILYDRHEL